MRRCHERWQIGWASVVLLVAALIAGNLSVGRAQAEPLNLGMLKVGASGPIYVAQDRGYFAAEGFDVHFVNFEAGQAVAVAVVSGDVDVAVTGLTAGLYNLANGGQIRVVGGLHREKNGFHILGYFASKRAYDGGLTSLKDVRGHSIAISTIGSTTHYAVGLLAMKYGIPMDSIRVLPMQAFSNSAAAVLGGQTDVALIPSTLNAEMAKGGAVNIGWVGDETPWQIGAIFVTTKTADERADMIKRFLRALGKGATDYHDAFTNAQEQRADGPDAPAVLAIVAKNIGAKPEDLDNQMPYVDPQLRLDIKDVRRQIDWYKAQGMMKGDITVEKLVDARYAVPLP